MTDPAAKYLTETIEIDPDVEAVLVSFDDQFSFPKLVKSTTYVCRYAKTFIATSEGRYNIKISFKIIILTS